MANPYQTPDTFDFGQTDLEKSGEWVDAPIWTRFCAFLIDAVMFLSLLIGIGYGVHLGMHYALMEPLEFYPLLAIGTVGGLASFIVLNWQGWKMRGQSFGKKALRIYIVRKSWEPCSIGRILLRTIPITLAFFLIPILGIAIGLADAVCIFRVDSGCLHDDMADTAVIRLALPKSLSAR